MYLKNKSINSNSISMSIISKQRTYNFNNSTVQIKFGNILDSESEVIVSSDDCFLSMGGGISQSILNAGGPEIYKDANKKIPSALGNVVVTTAGNLKQKFIFHAITIDANYAIQRFSEDDGLKKEIHQFIIKQSIKQCLRLMPLLNVSSISFPCIGAGVAAIPYERCAQLMAEALLEMLTSTNKQFDVQIWLFDRTQTMDSWDFLPFFEHFAGVELLSSKMNVPSDSNDETPQNDVDVVHCSSLGNKEHKVFISYSRKDYDRIQSICGLLNDTKISYWIDVDGTYSGENYKEVIVNAIKKTSLVLFISSENSNASSNVAKEVSMADKYGKIIIPIRLDTSPFSPKIDYDLNCIDSIDLFERKSENLEKLRKTILGKLVIAN